MMPDADAPEENGITANVHGVFNDGRRATLMLGPKGRAMAQGAVSAKDSRRVDHKADSVENAESRSRLNVPAELHAEDPFDRDAVCDEQWYADDPSEPTRKVKSPANPVCEEDYLGLGVAGVD